ncbi:MAG TPA: EAL domain-containing protein [Xanthobacteraceae bacterium]|nr:EAL domain-containing protein [Xanthobacteraceae bacterium]
MSILSETAPLRIGAPEQSRPAFRADARFGAMLPLCAIVAVAILCIVVAALFSAQRANEVAVEHEKDMLRNAIVYRGEWSLRMLHSVLVMDEAETGSAQIGGEPERLIGRIRSSYRKLIDHDFILIADGGGRLVDGLVNADAVYPELPPLAFAEIAPALAFLQGRTHIAPERVVWLAPPKMWASSIPSAGAAFLQTLSNGVSIIVSVVLSGDDKPVAILAVQAIDQPALTELGHRLLMTNLRQVGADDPLPADDYVYRWRDERGRTAARFAWTPHRPAAQVLYNVVPFIFVAIIGFALLTALVLRHMRRSASELAEAERRMRHLALHDPLCGLPNRIYFGEELETTLAKVRAGAPPAAVFYIDLDHFKDVNDTLGHSVGDELIRRVTQRLTQTLRGGDMVARLGGDEFAVITAAAPDQATLHAIARRIISTLCAPYLINGNPIVIGASVGIALIVPNTGDSAADIMRYADMALYRAKNEGRNRACIYDTAMDADLSRRKLLEQDLREAIENDRLDIAYQPIVNAGGEKIVGVEALVRWSHPERGFVSPVEFIPLAEHSGLIIQLGEWVMRRACREGLAWPELAIAVNVSPLQFRQLDFVETVERILMETGFDPGRLELELTESTLIGNVESADSAMRRLRAIGVRLALDDFGTGYSSMLYLRRFPFDKLKIDRSFVHAIERAPDAAAIINAIVNLGRGLGMKVTAEGVETAEQHLFLRAAGVHEMQGYRFGKPCTAAEITCYLHNPGAFRGLGRDTVAAIAS